MIPPRYQEVPAASIPRVEREGVVGRVVAGEAYGVQGAVETRTPIAYVHLTVEPGAPIRWPVPAGWNAMAYGISGAGRFGPDGTEAGEGQLVVFDDAAGDLVVAVPDDAARPLDALVLAGQPIREPLFRYGPFVMNTKAEIVEAIEDYQAGRLGRIER
ncbi:MAG: pirin-like C-terminal cupin domain-containing protein [Acidimicrobiales bacterium]